MTAQVILEKERGPANGVQLPLFVYDDGTPPGALSLAAAIAAVDSEQGVSIPTTYNGVPQDYNPTIERLSFSAFRITLNYRWPGAGVPLHPPGSGDDPRYRFACRAQLIRSNFLTEVAVFAEGSNSPPQSNLPTWGGAWNVRSEHGEVLDRGDVLDPPEPNLWAELTIPLASLDSSYGQTLVSSVGTVNNATLNGYPAGEIFLYSIDGRQISENEARLEIAWSWAENVTGEQRGAVEDIAYLGHDFVWNYFAQTIDRNRNVIQINPAFVIVNRPYAATDLSAIGVLPP